MFSWNSAAHQQWLSTPQNNHAAYANPIDCLAQVASFVMESQHALQQHNANVPLDVASRGYQQRTKLQLANRGAGLGNASTAVTGTTPAGAAPAAVPDASPAESGSAESTVESPEDWNDGSMDVSPVVDPSPQ